MNRPGDASHLSEEERAAWVERVKATFEDKRARSESKAPPTSPGERLEELERDAREGRTLKHDYRCSPEEKERMYRAANLLGLTVSEFVRDAVASACDEVLAGEPAGVS